MISLIQGKTAGDDGLLGRQLVLAGVAGTGHRPVPPLEYIKRQEQKQPSLQSHRTTARGLRELYRMLGFITETASGVQVTNLGREAGALAGTPLTGDAKSFWHRAFLNLRHGDSSGESHPYRVLLGLVERRPKISRAKCALALEAIDDSESELDRISKLSDQSEDRIRESLGLTRTTWDNAKKILPTVATQIGSIRILRDQAELTPIDETLATSLSSETKARHGEILGRSSRPVSPSTIAQLHSEAEFDEGQSVRGLTSEQATHAANLRADRLRRHQAIVKRLALELDTYGARLYEDPFDVLAVFDSSAVVFEVKTLSGEETDERERVREALGQLCYYSTFNLALIAEHRAYRKVACFEGPISQEHIAFLREYGIFVIWRDGDEFSGDPLEIVLGLGD